MFDSLSKLYEGKNIKRKMNLRTQLKNTKMQKGEMIQEYFSRISEIKEQLKAIRDTIDEDEFVITALNGLARPWKFTCLAYIRLQKFLLFLHNSLLI